MSFDPSLLSAERLSSKRSYKPSVLNVLGSILALAVFGAGAFWLGTMVSSVPIRQAESLPQVSAVTAPRVAQLEKEIARLQSDLDTQVNANRDLLTTLSQLERQLQIDKSAYDELSKSLSNASEEVAELQEEVSFYRNIVSPDGNQTGLRINDFNLRLMANSDGVDSQRWRFTLMIVQSVRQSDEVSGTLTLEVEGMEGAIQKIIDASTLGAEYAREVNFKYLHRVQGYIDVPETFEPIRVGVDFRAARDDTEPLKQWYPWPEA